MAKDWKHWEIEARDVLYEDECIIAVNKPAGLPSQATPDPGRDHCYAAVGRYLEKKGCHYVGLHHRLDALTSGVLVMTKDPAVNGAFGEQFREHRVRKVYAAICTGDGTGEASVILSLDPEGVDLRAPIGELPGGGIQRFGVDGRRRKPALTHVVGEACFRMRDGCVVLCRCMPLTGRTHQIRVHLSSIGLGIIGDPLYGGKLLRSLRSIDPQRMCLHAETITFRHPVTDEEMTVSAPRPKEFETFVGRVGKLYRAVGK